MDKIVLEDITMQFTGTRALDSVSLEITPGTIVALCGENGAGKSTLGKIMAGVYPHGSYDGRILIDGNEMCFSNTHDAEKSGIAMVYQELNLISDMTVAENICLGSMPNRMGIVDFEEMKARSNRIFSKLNLDIDPEAKICELSISMQQMVEIAKVISRNPQIIIFDEATSSLTGKEVEILFNVMRKLKEHGTTMIYVSHKLDEIFEVCDSVAILKDGKYINQAPVSKINKDTLISWMVGRELKDMFAPKTKHSFDDSPVVLEIKNWNVYKSIGTCTNKIVNNISLHLKKGEILGIYGLMGAGRTEFVSSVFEGDYYPSSGEVYMDGEKVQIRSSRDAINRGMALVTEDRRKTGLCLIHQVNENITLASLRKYANSAGVIDKDNEAKAVDEMVAKLKIKVSNVDVLVSKLSGGNQQKVVLSKWLLNDPKILILDEPTRGIDVGAKKEIYYILQQLADAGVSIIVVSSELPEVMGVSDRILVMRNGEIVGDVSGTDISEEYLCKQALGGDAS